MKINIIGPYPPPYGGISVHVKRMKKYLQNQDIDITVYNESKVISTSGNVIPVKTYKKFLFKIPFLKGNIVHFHTINKHIRVLLCLFKIFNKKILLTIHGESLHDQLISSTGFKKKLLIFSLKKLDKIICVNPKTVDELVQIGFNRNKVVHLSAYINPIENEYDFKHIPQDVWKFIYDSKYLISANGLVRFYNNVDLYGLDILIELIKKIKINGNEVNLLIAILGCESQNEEERKYYKKLKERIMNYDLNSNIFIFEVKDTEFYPILKKSKMFIRPTNTDGYGVSIAEALYYKVPSIASDVCDRPEGTILFKSRNLEDLYNKVKDVIDNYDLHKDMISGIKFEDNAEKILNVYKEIMKGEKYGN